VDDKAENIAVASKLGMQTVLFTHGRALQEQLAQISFASREI